MAGTRIKKPWVVSLVAGAVLAGIGLGGTSVSAASASGAGKLVVGYEADATSLDPAQVTDINSGQVLNQMYDTLVQYNTKGTMVGDLATSWTVTDHGLEYTFRLRPGVRFSNGDPLTPADVIFSFERQLDKSNPGYKYGPFPFGSFFFGDIKSVTSPGKDQVTFALSTAEASFMSSLTLLTGAVVDEKAALQEGKSFALHGMGTGPFALSSWQRGEQLVLKANPFYWGAKQHLSQVVFIPIVQSSERATDLLTGTVQMVVNPAPVTLGEIKSAGDQVVMHAGPHVWWIGLNTREKPFNSVLVRQAMNYAINRSAITKNLLFGTGIPADQPLAPGQLGYNPAVNPYNYNPTLAKKLLAKAGYPNGFSTTLLVPTSGSGMQDPISMGTAIQANLAAIGVKVQIQEMDWGTFLNRVNQGAAKGHMDMWELSWMDSAIDPSLVLDPLLSSASWPPGFNSGFYKDAKVDSLLSEADTTQSVPQRAKLYSEAEYLINRDAPWIFVDHAKAVVAYSPQVKNFVMSPAFPFYINLRGVSTQ